MGQCLKDMDCNDLQKRRSLLWCSGYQRNCILTVDTLRVTSMIKLTLTFGRIFVITSAVLSIACIALLGAGSESPVSLKERSHGYLGDKDALTADEARKQVHSFLQFSSDLLVYITVV